MNSKGLKVRLIFTVDDGKKISGVYNVFDAMARIFSVAKNPRVHNWVLEDL